MIFVLILSHFLSDFPLQTDEIVEGKKNLEWKAFAKHFQHHFIVAVVLFAVFYIVSNIQVSIVHNAIAISNTFTVFDFLLSIACIVLIGLIHIVLDYLKVIIYKEQYGLFKFSLDQVLHVTVIYLIAYAVFEKYYQLQSLISANSKYVLMILIGILLSTYVISFVIDKIMKVFKVNKVEVKEEKQNKEKTEEVIKEKTSSALDEKKYNISSIIGMIERLIIVGALLSGLELVVVVVIGFKTLISYNAERKISAEYFIIGNLLSIGFAVLTVGLMNFLMNL